MYKEGVVMNTKIVFVSIAVALAFGAGTYYLMHYKQQYPNSLLTNGKIMQLCSNKQNGNSDSKAMPERSVVQKKVLSNGMTVLVHPVHAIPKVSLQIWYNVGSKDEATGEKGIAHLIEHMIFKGTAGEDSLNLSESDINAISHTLSSSTNAFTAQDFTGYSFDLPANVWQEALPIMADCMVNCAFKDDHLNSEMKAVIQELKMRKDKYQLSLTEELMSTIFAEHPYHYPIIGYKQDLWHVHGDDLRAFYKKHYWPNNAVLVVVGDVQTEDVFDAAEKNFGHLEPNRDYKKQTFYYNKDIASKEVTLYRDVAQPVEIIAFVIPGTGAKMKSVIDVAALILGSGKSSCLYQKIVDELHLATSLGAYYWDILFDHSLFFIAFEPKDIESIPAIEKIITEEIGTIVKNGVSSTALTTAINKARMNFYERMEDTYSQARDIGMFYLATGDENYVFNYLNESPEQINCAVQQLFAEYFRPSLMHKGKLLPLPAQEKQAWAHLQKLSDEEDTRFLNARPRTTPVEPPVYAEHIHAAQTTTFDFPKARTAELSNGLKVLSYNNTNTPTINILIRLKAQNFYDSQDLPGLYSFTTAMLDEGTENYTACQLAHELGSRGMAFSATPGSISLHLLSKDLKKGLEILLEILTKTNFAECELEKVRKQIFSEIKNFWDNPSSFTSQLVKERIYQGHPYSKNILGTQESIAKISRQDLIALYKKFITPVGAVIAVVGDLSGYDVPTVLESTLGAWKGSPVEDIQFPELAPLPATARLDHPINRDQIVLGFAGLSIDRMHNDFDKLLLFDQILAGGVLGSMQSRLYELREQSGLFYSIGGTLIAQSNEQPGMILVKTLVSRDRLNEAEKAIQDTLAHVADHITEQELAEAKNAILNSLMLNFESNGSMASAFIFLERYKFPADYFDKRADTFAAITTKQVQDAVKRVLHADQLLIFRVGRIS
jgi:zinc protease